MLRWFSYSGVREWAPFGFQINTFKSAVSLVTPWIVDIFPSYPWIFKVDFSHSILLRRYKRLTVSRFAAIDGVHAGSGLRWQRRSCGQIQQWSCLSLPLVVFPILLLNSTSAPFIPYYYWVQTMHHWFFERSKPFFDTNGSPVEKLYIWWGPRSVVSLFQQCLLRVKWVSFVWHSFQLVSNFRSLTLS